MAKENPLSQGLKNAASAKEAPEHQAPERSAPAPRAAVRRDTKLVGGHFPQQVSVALKVIAAENQTTVQDLLADSINGIFAKYGKPQIAPLRAKA